MKKSAPKPMKMGEPMAKGKMAKKPAIARGMKAAGKAKGKMGKGSC